MSLAQSSVMVPYGTAGAYAASGTVATCEVNGFIIQFSLTQAAYTTFICVYYTLILRYRVREKVIATRIEPWVHLLAFLFPLVLGSVSVAADMYNPANSLVGWCSRNGFPVGCSRREDLECERGDNLKILSLVASIPYMFFFAVVCLSSVLTYWKVRSVERRGSQWSTSQQPSEVRIRETRIQAFLYVSTFLFTYCYALFFLFGPPPTKEHRYYYFPVSIWGKLALPMQGFWNFFIYVRPRFAAIRRRQPDRPWWSALQDILHSKDMAAKRTSVRTRGTQRRWWPWQHDIGQQQPIRVMASPSAPPPIPPRPTALPVHHPPSPTSPVEDQVVEDDYLPEFSGDSTHNTEDGNHNEEALDNENDSVASPTQSADQDEQFTKELPDESVPIEF